MKSQTVIGFDFGLKYIGVAVGQTVTGTANPLATIHAHYGKPQWDKINELIAYWKPDALIVGMPLALDGSEQSISQAARHFADLLQQRYSLPVHLVDERYTTREAKSDLFAKGGFRALEKTKVDGWSAKIITESGLTQMMNVAPPQQKIVGRHFLSTKNIHPAQIINLMDRASQWIDADANLVYPPQALLKNKTIANLFFENSTRTRCSFEIAARRLGIDVLNFDISSSSLKKGESLFDTLDYLQAMGVDLFVIRHSETGIPAKAADHLDGRAAVINAGDGVNEHPSQALLDLFTLRNYKPNLKDLKVAIVGDIRHSRVAHSNVYAMAAMGVPDIRLIGPKSLLDFDVQLPGLSWHTDLIEGIKGVDVVMMLRIQQERMQQAAIPDLQNYFQNYGLTAEKLVYAQGDAIVMHPGPMNREVEISSAVADGPQSVILKQASFGVAMRMAIILELLTSTTASN